MNRSFPSPGRHHILRGRHLALAAACFFVVDVAVAQQPIDRVRLVSGGELQGDIVASSPNGVEIETKDGPRKASIETIRDVRFADEPESLRDARGMLLRRDGAGALDELAKIEAAELERADDDIKADVAYVRAAATARKALALGRDLPAGSKGVSDFLAAHPRSLHLYAMQELLGDLLAAQGRPSEAKAAYAVLDKGPPAIEVRGAILEADLLVRQSAFGDALREYEAAAKVASGLPGEPGARARAEAELGRARCLVRLGKGADAVAVVLNVLATIGADNDSLGRCYNMLGEAHLAIPGHDQDAIVAFLTAQLVHGDVPEDHAEALFHLVDLWDKVNHPERAREARQLLETTYPDSPWTKKLKPTGGS